MLALLGMHRMKHFFHYDCEITGCQLGFPFPLHGHRDKKWCDQPLTFERELKRCLCRGQQVSMEKNHRNKSIEDFVKTKGGGVKEALFCHFGRQ